MLDVPHGLDHQEQRVVVAFELRPLVRFERVLYRQLVQPEGVGDALDLVGIRLVQPDPDESVAPLTDLLDGLGVRPTAG